MPSLFAHGTDFTAARLGSVVWWFVVHIVVYYNIKFILYYLTEGLHAFWYHRSIGLRPVESVLTHVVAIPESRNMPLA
jgi:hypothetical protein